MVQQEQDDAGWHTQVVAAIDQGTQSTRVYLFDKSFQPVASHQVPVQQIKPQNGWIEHDPMAIWNGVRECLSNAITNAKESLGTSVVVKAIGLTNQRETTVVWHRVTGLPLYNAIVWQDNRTSMLVEELTHVFGSKDCFRDVTGLPLSTYFSALKFKWMYDNLEHVRVAVDQDQAMFGTMDSWLIYQLTGGGMSSGETGVHVTDVTNASRTLLMDLKTCQWHLPLFEVFSVRPSVLPKICSSAEIYGYVAEGPLKGVPISGCVGDQMAALLGQRCNEGEAKNTYGTGLFMMLNTGSKIVKSSHGLLTTVGYQIGPNAPVNYALEGAIAVGGMGISWLKDNLGIIDDAAEVEALAGSVKSTNGVYFVPAFTGLLAPYWEDSARGTILGLTTFTNKAHIARAMLEAICFQTREVLDAMRMDADLGDLTILRVDGGCTKNDLLMQLQADILQMPVLRPQFQETTALGAALAAGMGAGIWTEEQVFYTHSYNNTEFHPLQCHMDAEVRYRSWKKAVARSFDQADLRHEIDTASQTRMGSRMGSRAMSRASSMQLGSHTSFGGAPTSHMFQPGISPGMNLGPPVTVTGSHPVSRMTSKHPSQIFGSTPNPAGNIPVSGSATPDHHAFSQLSTEEGHHRAQPTSPLKNPGCVQFLGSPSGSPKASTIDLNAFGSVGGTVPFAPAFTSPFGNN